MQTNILPREKELHNAHAADNEIISKTAFEMMSVCRNLSVSMRLFDDTPDENADMKKDLAEIIGRLYRCRQFADDVIQDISKTLSKANNVASNSQIEKLKERVEVLAHRGEIARSSMSTFSNKYNTVFPDLDGKNDGTTELMVSAMYASGIGNLIYMINFLSMVNIPEYLQTVKQMTLKEVDKLVLDMMNEKYAMLHSLAEHIDHLPMWSLNTDVSTDDAEGCIDGDVLRLQEHLSKANNMITRSLQIIRDKAPRLHNKLKKDFVYMYLASTYLPTAP